MKFRNLLSILAFTALFLISCENPAENLGMEVRPSGDEIIVKADTFHLTSKTIAVENIISKPDSFLLGKFNDPTLGITSADILSELKLFEDGFTFLDNSVAKTEADSVVMSIVYSSYFGSPNSPLHVGVYELKDSLKRLTPYLSNMDPAPFVDYSKTIGDTTFTVLNGNTGKINNEVRFHMKPEFVNRFFTTNPLHYKNQNEFRNFFKGIYVTTEYYGSATMLNIQVIRLSLYYHYAYNDDLSKKIYGRKDFYANPEVKKVNRIAHPLRTLTISPDDEFNYVTAPANYYTEVRLPLDRIKNRVKVDGKHLDINSASIKINVEKKESADQSVIPYVNSMLLIKKDALDRFFKTRETLSDTCSFLATRDSIYISRDNYRYEFNFSGLSRLIANEIKNTNNPTPYLDMVLVPVTPLLRQSSSSSNVVISEINQSNLMQSVKIYSGKNKKIPMKMEVIYSGF